MGGRLSRLTRTVPKFQPTTPAKETLPNNADPPVKFRQQEVVEERDPVFEENINQLFGKITSTETVFVPGSDPISAEAKRKARREFRRQLLASRISTGTFKDILTEYGRNQKELLAEELVQQLAEKHEVDKTLLSEVLQHCRFPPLHKRYDGYVVADRWD